MTTEQRMVIRASGKRVERETAPVWQSIPPPGIIKSIGSSIGFVLEMVYRGRFR